LKKRTTSEGKGFVLKEGRLFSRKKEKEIYFLPPCVEGGRGGAASGEDVTAKGSKRRKKRSCTAGDFEKGRERALSDGVKGKKGRMCRELDSRGRWVIEKNYGRPRRGKEKCSLTPTLPPAGRKRGKPGNVICLKQGEKVTIGLGREKGEGRRDRTTT